MKKIKVFALLATLFVGIFSNLFTPVVSAVELSGDATVTIHKVKDYKNGEIINTGSELNFPPDVEFLEGITYNVYDVTAAYHAEYYKVYITPEAKDADEAARKHVQGDKGHAPKVSGATLVATAKTVGGGAATFTLPKKSDIDPDINKTDYKDAVYVFVEKSRAGITTVADNLVLSFPVYKLSEDGKSYTDKELEEIHLYPKNTTETIGPKKYITTLNDNTERTNYNIGEEIGFKLSTQIPTNIGITTEVDGTTLHYNTFGLIDTHDTTLAFDKEDDKHQLKVADTDIVLEKNTDYNILVGETAEGEPFFKVELTEAGIKNLATHGGEFLEFTYTMKLNADAVMDTKNDNKVTVEYGRKTDTFDDVVTEQGNKKEVYTGGYRFIKTDVSKKTPLAGATFVVRDADDDTAKYLKIYDKTKEIEWVTSDTDATKFTTEANGIVDITGLKYGTYYLEETKAPTGYVRLSKRITFDVEIGSYNTTTTTPHNVANTPKGLLPSTGGAGIILFVALGLAMVGLAGVYFTSRRKDS
ncbi:TPA: SpaH/EbpB family LPXTG-anchored major pilin [Streptococcus suis]